MRLLKFFPLLALLRGFFAFVVVFWSGARDASGAEPSIAQGHSVEESLKSVRHNLRLVEENQDLEAERKSRLLEAYQSAQSYYEDAKASEQKEAAFRESIQSDPDDAAKFREDLKNLGETISTNSAAAAIPKGLSAADLEQMATSARAELAGLKNQLNIAEERVQQLQSRPVALRERQEQVASALAEIEEALQGAAAGGDAFEESTAKRAVMLARKAARSAEAAALEQEDLSLSLRSEKSMAERDWIAQQAANQQVRVGALDGLLVKQRQSEVEQQRREAEEAAQKAADKHPLVEKLAQDYAALIEERADLMDRVDGPLKSELEALEAQTKKVTQEYDLARQRIKDVGLSDALAVRLLDQWRRLPSLRTHRAALDQQKEAIAEAVALRLQAEDNLMALPDAKDPEQVKAWCRAHYAEARLGGADAAEVQEEAGRLLEDRRDALTSLIEDYNRLLQQLGDLDFKETKHIALVEEYTAFLEERLLWIPSAPPWKPSALREAASSLQWLASGQNRREILQAALAFPKERPWIAAVVGMLLLFSLGARPFIRRKEQEYSVGVKRISTDSFGITLRAAFLLLLQSAPVASVLALLGWHLLERESDVEILRGLGSSLLYAAVHLFGILILLNVCRPWGLGQAHFRWNPALAAMMRRQLFWFLPVVLCCTVLIDLAEELTDEFHRTGLSRLALTGLLLAVAFLLFRAMRPKDGVLSGVLSRSPEGWLVRLQPIWYGLLVLAPIGLGVLSALGYHHTAVQLTRQAAITVSFFVGVFVAHQLIRRWFLAKERKLKLDQWLAHRRMAAKSSGAADGASEEALRPEVDEEAPDVKTLGEQTRRFLRSLMSFSLLLGVWWIWADVLPALNALDAVEIWYAEASDGGTERHPVTLNDLALSLLIAIITTVAVRNVSGVLEIGILQNLPLAPGSRYAIVSVAQYVVVLLGIVFAFNVLGFTLAQFGWIMAALSVGLGFGLQEVVANFVSGVILLAERPIRVGDTVTVSDVSGVVTKIRIRATTITNWSRQELIVPNKEFITGRILNWTLTNTINRIVVEVGVAYGADTEKARQILLNTAKSHPLIMSEPGPLATFEGFDDSSLRLVLRCYLPTLENRLGVTTELHTAIHCAFAAADIEIPFPQRDIRVHWPEPSPKKSV